MVSKYAKYFLLSIIFFNSAAFGQYYFFGRNKVQYERFDWKVLRTKHFNIYYYDEMGEIAGIGAAYAEQTYEEYKVKFNEVISHRIPLIFYNTSNQFEQTNTTPGLIPEGVGGFFEYMKGRVVIPNTGSLHDFRHVIRHELTHVFMAAKLYRIFKDHRLPNDSFPPLWYTEGLAEYISTPEDAQAKMVLRDAIINNYFFNLENIYRISGTFLMYKEGQDFLEFVAKRYGKEKVLQMLENFWMYSTFAKVMEYTLGRPIKEIDKEWTFYLKKKFYPLITKDAPPEIAAQKLTDFGFNFSPVPFKIGGKEYLYFVANRDGYSSIYRLELNDKMQAEIKPELVLRGEKSEEFESFHLFQSSIDISKNGLLAFVTKTDGTDAIHFLSVKDSKVIMNYQNPELITISSPKFSPDGNRVVFEAVDKKGFSDIYILHLPDLAITRLTNDIYDDEDPCFGLNDQIIFSSDRTGGEFEKNYNLFSYNLNTHSIQYVTYLNTNNFSPVISPDKKELLFTSELDGVRNAYELKIDGENFSDTVKKVTHFITSAYNPVYLNRDEIVMSGFENFEFNLYRMKIDSLEIDSSSAIVMNMASARGKWLPIALSSTSQKEKIKYEKQYSLDYAQSQVSTDPVFGTQGGAVVSLSDLLGNDNYYFLIYNTAQVQSDILKSFNVEIERINLGQRANYGYGVFQFSGNRYDITESDEFYYERSFGGFFTMFFPLSTFDRIETDVSLINSDKQIVTGVIERKALLVSNTVSYVFDNSLWGPTGPIDGIRAKFLLGYTGDVKYSNVNYYSVIADYRQYFRFSYSSAFAVRAALFYNQGKEARRYFMGGSWDMRGWPLWSIRGEKMWLTSMELRFPLIDQLNIKFPFIDLGFAGIRGALFVDTGSAWDTQYTSTLGDLGGGIRINFFNALVLRYDVGKKIEDNFSRLQHGLFYQFFFGWDF